MHQSTRALRARLANRYALRQRFMHGVGAHDEDRLGNFGRCAYPTIVWDHVHLSSYAWRRRIAASRSDFAIQHLRLGLR